MSNFKSGDRVKFARAFLQSTCQFTGRAPFIAGTVNGITMQCGRNDLVSVTWDDNITSDVLSCNLVKTNRLHLERV